MNEPSFLGLVQNIALLLALVLVFDIFSIRDRVIQVPFRQAVSGFLIGVIGMVVMLTPWVLTPGVIFDTRSVLLSISGLFFGTVPTLIAMAITAALRFYQGGSGALAGILVILATGSIGIAWRRFCKHPLVTTSWQELYLFGILSHLVMLALMLTLPWDIAQRVLANISLPVMVIYPVGTVLLGLLMINRRRREDLHEILSQTTNRLNATQRLTKMGGWEWDVAQQSMFWTDEVYRIYGFSAQEFPPGSPGLIQKSLLCYNPTDRQIVQAAFQACLEKGQAYDLELLFTSASDEQLWIHTMAEAVIEQDKVVRVVGNIMDITEHKQAEGKIKADQIELQRLYSEATRSRHALLSVVEDQKEAQDKIRQLNADLEQRVAERTAQLTSANQELEAFSYSVSHDLRAPLRALDGFSAALLEDYAGKLDERGRHHLARIQEASRRMAQLIEDLLNLSRVARREMHFGHIDLGLVARQIADELHAQVPERKIIFDIAPDLIARVDYNLLKIALENLLSNALKFTAQRDQAHVQVGKLDQLGQRVFFVRDNGVGFNMAYADKLFSPFQRLHSVQEFPGTGIGLSLVQRIIARHGGRIWAEAAVGQGATFYFTLGDKING